MVQIQVKNEESRPSAEFRGRIVRVYKTISGGCAFRVPIPVASIDPGLFRRLKDFFQQNNTPCIDGNSCRQQEEIKTQDVISVRVSLNTTSAQAACAL